MKEKLDLWDINDGRVCVKIKREIVRELFKQIIQIAATQANLAKKIGIRRLQVISDWKTGKFYINLLALKKILDLLSISKKQIFEEKIENNLEGIRVRESSKPIKKPKFPISVEPQFLGLLANIICDGSIQIIENGKTPLISYTNKSRILLTQFKQRINEFGQLKLKEKENIGNVKEIRCPAIISVLIEEILEAPLTECYEVVPFLIVKQSNNAKKIFLQSVFDDEGCVTVKKYQIIIEMVNELLIKVIKKILLEFGINSGKISPVFDERGQTRFRLGISGRNNLIKFSEVIGFKNQDKSNKLLTLIRKYKKQKSYIIDFMNKDRPIKYDSQLSGVHIEVPKRS